jgi:hypothetical protein
MPVRELQDATALAGNALDGMRTQVRKRFERGFFLKSRELFNPLFHKPLL